MFLKQRGHDNFLPHRRWPNFAKFSLLFCQRTRKVVRSFSNKSYETVLLFARLIWQTQYKWTKSNENENHPTARRDWLIARLVLETTTRWTEYSWYTHCRFYIRHWGQLASSQMAVDLLLSARKNLPLLFFQFSSLSFSYIWTCTLEYINS